MEVKLPAVKSSDRSSMTDMGIKVNPNVGSRLSYLDQINDILELNPNNTWAINTYPVASAGLTSVFPTPDDWAPIMRAKSSALYFRNQDGSMANF